MVGKQNKIMLPGLAALEAVALISEHGFKELGLNRIYGGQAYPGLKSWNKLLEVIGYQVDGIERNALRRGHKYSDKLEISLIFEDYLKISKSRGKLWPSMKKIKEIIRKQPKNSFAEILNREMERLKKEHYKYIF